MIKFLFKGIIRDKSRSLFPVLIVMAGVALTVLAFNWLNGALNIFFETNAKFNTGHVKIMSRAYAEEADQIPNDLALSGIKDLQKKLKKEFPQLIWTPRIKFGGLLDIPDERGETKAQGPMAGLAVDLLSPSSPEKEILNLKKAIVRGRLPEKPGEVLISDEFARKLGVRPGETATIISSTMYGSMATANYTVVGTLHFGVTAMDRGAMIADISDIQFALEMDDSAGEILGFFKDNLYRDGEARAITKAFNDAYSKKDDEFSPIMETLLDQSGMREYFNIISSYSSIALGVFVLAMSIVLWNAGLMGNLRRYGEIGVRLAIGEDKGHIYRSMIAESLMIGFIGSVFGTLLGLAVSYYLQVKGINISFAMKGASLMISDVMRAKVTPISYVIGFIPGLLATIFGSAISGIGIYKRQTSLLMKELEA
jgi:putative ABC transport system permease protein